MNYKLTTIIAAVILAAGITSLGCMVRSGILGFKDLDRVVSVKGLAEKEVMADMVVWPISYSIMGDNLTTLYNEMESKNGDISAFVKRYKIEDKDISVAIPNVEDLKTNTWNTDKITERYKISSTITVTSSDIENAREAMKHISELMTKGIAVSNSPYGNDVIRFEYNSLNSIKPQMIEEATRNAREAAEKFAKDSDSKIGKIKTASQGQFSISTPDSNAPHKKLVRVVTTISYNIMD